MRRTCGPTSGRPRISRSEVGKSVLWRTQRTPTSPRAGSTGSRVGEPPREVGEVDAGARAQALPAPHARVDVEQLELAARGVALVLELHEAGEPQLGQQPLGRLDDLGLLDRLDVGARTTEVGRVLARATSDHGRERSSARRTARRTTPVSHRRPGRAPGSGALRPGAARRPRRSAREARRAHRRATPWRP